MSSSKTRPRVCRPRASGIVAGADDGLRDVCNQPNLRLGLKAIYESDHARCMPGHAFALHVLVSWIAMCRHLRQHVPPAVDLPRPWHRLEETTGRQPGAELGSRCFGCSTSLHHKHLKDESPAMKMRFKTKKRHLVTAENAGLARKVAVSAAQKKQTAGRLLDAGGSESTKLSTIY